MFYDDGAKFSAFQIQLRNKVIVSNDDWTTPQASGSALKILLALMSVRLVRRG
jgi:hypothetical protein